MNNAPARCLLDTSAVITRPPPDVFAPDVEFMICTITVAELNAGLHGKRDPIELSIRVSRLQWISEHFRPIPFTTTDARTYGQLVATTIASGRDPKPRRMDLLIASVAATRGIPLATYNGRDFRGLESLVQLIDLGTPPT